MTRSRRIPKKARFVDVLIHYDQAQLVLLEWAKFKILGVAIDRADMAAPFFAAEVREGVASKYFAGRADLHFVFRSGVEYYMFDLPEGGDEVDIRPATKEEIDNQANWPKPGLFSRSHTSRHDVATVGQSKVQAMVSGGRLTFLHSTERFLTSMPSGSGESSKIVPTRTGRDGAAP